MPLDLRKIPEPKPLNERQERWLSAMKQFKNDPQRYIGELEELTQYGGSESQIIVGRLYSTNSGILRDYNKAEKWFRLGAQGDPAKGNWYLGMLFMVQKKYESALEKFKLSAEQGYAPAYYFLGRQYFFGQGVPKNWTTAKVYLQRAYELGSLPAGMILSRLMYQEPKGIKAKLKAVTMAFRVGVAISRAKREGPMNAEMFHGLPKDLLKEPVPFSASHQTLMV